MKKLFRKQIAILILSVTFLCLSACTLTKHKSANAQAVRATVIEIEKFGHVLLDITAAEFTAAGYELGDLVCVRFGSYEEELPFYDGYYSNPGDGMLRGTTPEHNVAICINYGSFADETGISIGDTVELTMAEKASKLALQELCALKYSNNRADYPDDATFANFRAVTLGRIGTGKLYRTASPISNKNGRAAYANDLIAAAKVATILNLADSYEKIEEFFAAEDFHSVYYRDLYEAGAVAALDLAGNFFDDSFSASIAEGLTFLSQNEPPYCIHCTEGKDRAGFASIVLEALMGAELDAIIDDYMLSFYNYYGIDQEHQPERYQIILDNNLIPVLCHITGAETRNELEQIDLEAAVTAYLLHFGMTEENITMLKEKLCD